VEQKENIDSAFTLTKDNHQLELVCAGSSEPPQKKQRIISIDPSMQGTMTDENGEQHITKGAASAPIDDESRLIEDNVSTPRVISDVSNTKAAASDHEASETRSFQLFLGAMEVCNEGLAEASKQLRDVGAKMSQMQERLLNEEGDSSKLERILDMFVKQQEILVRQQEILVRDRENIVKVRESRIHRESV
jgi:hypothetical protein